MFLDSAGRQVGTGVSAKMPNDDPANPPSNVSFAITQLPATITDSTVFERSATTTYDPAAGGYTWSDKVAVTGTVHQKGVQEVTGAAVSTLAGVAGMVFKQGDRFYLRGVPVAQDGKTIELGTARVKSFARRPFLLLDPFVEANDRRNHVLLEPDDESDAYHVRRVSLDPKSGDISWDPGVNLGTFALPVSDAALHASGKVVVINTNSGRLGWIQPADTPRPRARDLRRRAGHPGRPPALAGRRGGHQSRHRVGVGGRHRADRGIRPQRQSGALLQGRPRLRPCVQDPARLRGAPARHGRRRQ